MNLLFITLADFSGQGGSNVATKEIVIALSRREDVELTVISTEPDNSFPDRLDTSPIDHHFLKSSTTNPQNQLQLIHLAHKVIQQKEVDIVVSRKAPVLIAPTLISIVHQVPHLLLIRGTIDFEVSRIPPLLKSIYWFNVRFSDYIFVAFEEVYKQVEQISPSSLNKTEIIANAADPDQFSPISNTAARADLDLAVEENELIVGFVGNIAERHCVEELVRAVALVKDEIKIRLLIIGNGSQRRELERLAEKLEVPEEVTFVGAVPHDRVSIYINACDLSYGVVDDNSPSNPIKCYEYLACERPVITSDAPELSFVADNDLGYVLDSVTPEEIANAIRAFRYTETDERKDMGQRGRKYILENHTWDVVATEILQNSQN